jgi:outer membrane translocation and assembly module TamA
MLTRTAKAASLAGLLVAGAGCLHARGPATHLARFRGVEIVGTKALDRDLVASKVYFGPNGIDVSLVEDLYSSMGYPEAKAEVHEVRDGTGRVRFRIQISEGRFSRLVQLTLYGLDDLPEATWTPALPLKVGSGFSPHAFESTRAALMAALRGAGYPDAEIVDAAYIDRALEVRASFYVVPGPRGEPYRFGPVFVAGNVRVPRERIRSAAEPLVPRGQPFDVKKLDAVRERVVAVGAFRTVTVTPGAVLEKTREIPVLVVVQEEW